MEALRRDRRYTYADFLTWDNDALCELIDGVPYMLASPTQEHQRIQMELSGQIWQFLKGKSCQVYTAPFDVRLNSDAGDDTVLQPDILVVCDRSKLADGKSCVGAPDMAIEILSPSTAGRDCIIKLHKYLESGVREYWLVDPDGKTVGVHVLMDGQHVNKVYAGRDVIPLHVLDGCKVNLSDVFAE